MVNGDELGIVVLTSQEKWDRMKDIVRKLLGRVQAGDTFVNHAELSLDRGFLVYLCQAYPAMTPYLKGIHLTLETWRGGRNEEGWKLPPKDSGEEREDTWEEVEAMPRSWLKPRRPPPSREAVLSS